MIFSAGSGDSFRDNFPLFGNEFLEEFYIFVIDVFDAHLSKSADFIGLQHTHFVSVVAKVIVVVMYHNYSLISLDSSSVRNLSKESDV